MKNLFSATLLLSTALLGATACNSGGIDSSSFAPPARWNEARAAIASPDDPILPAYFGDEYAQVQRALRELPGEPAAPTF